MVKPVNITLEIGATPDKYELATAHFFAKRGQAVLFLCPAKIKGERTPDITMNGVKWEIKNPHGAGKFTIEHAIQDASKQSEFIIVDLRNCKMPEAKALVKIKREFKYRTKIKRIIVIKKNDRSIDLAR